MSLRYRKAAIEGAREACPTDWAISVETGHKHHHLILKSPTGVTRKISFSESPRGDANSQKMFIRQLVRRLVRQQDTAK